MGATPKLALVALPGLILAGGCAVTFPDAGESAASSSSSTSGGGGGPAPQATSSGSAAAPGSSGEGGGPSCPSCEGAVFVDCDGSRRDCGAEGLACQLEFECTACSPGSRRCADAETVEECGDDGSSWEVAALCDANAGAVCAAGECESACEVAAAELASSGCEIWAVDLDQQDGGGNDPASEPWGVLLTNAGDATATVTVHVNGAAVGSPVELSVVLSISLGARSSETVILPTRELDCGVQPNDYESPGTCLSSRAFRITSTVPILATQLNTLGPAFSTDASLLLPTHALGRTYRVIGWHAGHPIEIDQFPGMVDRSYITVVGTAENTSVVVRPSWRIKGNPPIAATEAGGEIGVTLNPFDVLNLETATGDEIDDEQTIADLSGSAVYADKPVAVFSGSESAQVPTWLDIPTYPGWDDGGGGGCCLDHLEEQLVPLEAVGRRYMVTRSPVRLTSSYREPDVIRFVGAAEVASVTTTLPAPFDAFDLQPGEVRTTWTQDPFTAIADRPFLLAQLQVGRGYAEGSTLGDPSMTVFAAVEQYRAEYAIAMPASWIESWVVISAEVGAAVSIDGASPAGCIVEPGGTVDSATYESRTCALGDGFHHFSGEAPFGLVAYGYADGASYAFVGGCDFKRIYEPPAPVE